MITFTHILSERVIPQDKFDRFWNMAKHAQFVKTRPRSNYEFEDYSTLETSLRALAKRYGQIATSVYDLPVPFSLKASEIGIGRSSDAPAHLYTRDASSMWREIDGTKFYEVTVNFELVLQNQPFVPRLISNPINRRTEQMLASYIQEASFDIYDSLKDSWKSKTMPMLETTLRHEFTHIEQFSKNNEPYDKFVQQTDNMTQRMFPNGEDGIGDIPLEGREHYYGNQYETTAYANEMAKLLSDAGVKRSELTNVERLKQATMKIHPTDDMWDIYSDTSKPFAKRFWKLLYTYFDHYEKEKRKYAL